MALEMNFFLSILLSLLSILLYFISLIHKNKNNNNNNNKNRSKKKKLPPGDLGLPWIGETLEFYRAQRNNRIFEEFVQPRTTKHGTIFKTRLIGSPTVVVSGAAANRFFLSNEFKLVVSSWPSASVQLMGKNSIMEKQGDHHRCIRAVIAASLSCSGLETLVPKICNSVEVHLNTHWQGQETIGLFRSTKVLTFSIVFECLFGIKVEPGMLEMFERVLEGVFAPPVEFPGSKFWRAKKARMEIERMLVNIVRNKRKEMEMEGEEEDGMLLSRLVASLIRGEIKEEEVLDNIVLLVFAAHDTTSFAIAMVCRMLAHHPNCYERLLQEHIEIMDSKKQGETLTLEDTHKMKYTWQVARESMRLFPPIFGSFRKAIVDIEYEGFTIPKGWKILWTTYGSHYDPQNFSDPLSFDPSRFEEPVPPYVFVPFGGGPRICAGYQLAKSNILVFLHFMVTRYNWSLVHPDEPITIDPLPFPYHGMPIKIAPKFL
ncbi:Cytochrome P450 [Macleaya cordata]|uniref:Cytochrome P450 n=1 Tax=Macleaya cordata TaxID=56857 RepID=A0A200R878_MACCD|nr:Cytochrome P450 [Macleaya cordata]